MKLNRILYAVVAIAFFCCGNTMAATQTQFNDQQVQAIQQIVHDYIVKNPQVLIEASQTLQKQQMEQMQKAAESAIKANAKQLFNAKGKPVAGNKDGKIVMIEFFDYQCPHCKDMASAVEGLIKANPDLKVIFAEFPIFGAVSKYAADAAIASVNQGKYYPFHNALLATEDRLTNKKVIEIAKSVGINVAKLRGDMKAKAITNQIKDNFDLAGKIKLMGTPAFAIINLNNQKVSFVPGQTDQKGLQDAVNQVK